MNQISEYSDAGITVRGTYYPPGKEPKSEDDEKKLYLAIEATSDMSLQKAKYEIKRIIREELLRLVSLSLVFSVLRFVEMRLKLSCFLFAATFLSTHEEIALQSCLKRCNAAANTEQ